MPESPWPTGHPGAPIALQYYLPIPISSESPTFLAATRQGAVNQLRNACAWRVTKARVSSGSSPGLVIERLAEYHGY